MRKRWLGTVVAVAALLAGFAAGLVAATAQEATPVAVGGYPAHIHIGPCDNLGDVVYPLNAVGGAAPSGTPGATPVSLSDREAAAVIARSRTEVDASLDVLLDGEFAVNVHKSAAEMDVYVACGEIAGKPADGTLTVLLDEENGSGVAGQALLQDLGNGRTMVTITLTAASDEGMASPVASPVSG